MGKLYEKKITLGRSADGKLLRKSVYAKTKAELERKVFQARQDYLTQAAADPDSSITMVAFARRWLQTEKAQKSTYTKAQYSNIIENYLAPYFEELYFHELTTTDFQKLINDHSDTPTICRKIRGTLSQIYSSADEAGLLSGRVPNFKRLALPPIPKPQTRALTEAEKDAIFKADFTDKEKALVYILYFTGMRREEAVALEPSCFDFRAKTVTVKQTVTFQKGGTIITKSAKNFYSLRVINLPERCVPFLREYVAGCKKWLFPSNMDPEKLLCTSSFHLIFNRIKKKMAVLAPEAATLHPHLFRHNYATMLYYSQISPKMAAKLMGHADTTMITKVYAHLDESKENAAEKLNAIFNG